MALIAMAVFDTEENKRSQYTLATLRNIFQTVDFCKHRLIIVDNNSCEETKKIIEYFLTRSAAESFNNRYYNNLQVITLPENIGTARAINQAWKIRNEGEHAIKMDNDIIIHSSGWVDEMEQAIRRQPQIGIVGLKRKDLIQTTWHEDSNYRSELIMLPHNAGEKWITFEKTNDVIGTCTMFNSALLNRVGWSYQPGLYGYEDTLFCHRSHLAGFMNGFLNHIEIEHIDAGATPYQNWKEKHSSEHTNEMIRIFREYVTGKRNIYEEFN
jgi:glycosyltransferase involved in cell wall biosynthesis